jgi:CelD/BcsL family acetyltransferase involved in cellulose biosynthesis
VIENKSVMTMPFRLVVYRGKEGLESIAEDWLRIEKAIQNRHLGHSYYYYASCLDGLVSAADEICFYTVWKNHQITAILPLQLSTRRFSGLHTRVLESPSAIYLPFYDIISNDSAGDPNITEIAVQLLKAAADLRWDVLLFNSVPEKSRIARDLSAASPCRMRKLAAHSDYLTCQPFEEYKRILSKNFRGNLRKALNKLNARTGVQYVCRQEKAEAEIALSRFVELEAAGWKGKVGGAIAQRPQLNRYYLSLINCFDREPTARCEINELWVEDLLASSQICLRLDDTVYVLKVAYREDFANLAPGNLLLAWLINRSAVNDGVRFVNLVSDTEWHIDWRPETIQRLDFEIYKTPVMRNTVHLLRYVKKKLVKRTWFSGLAGESLIT